MHKNRYSFAVAGIILACLFSACSIDWDRRKPLVVQDVTQQLPVYSDIVAVYFEESVPNRPLVETVWDNVSGPLWNVEESNRIGFTQTYSGPAPLLPPGFLGVIVIRTRIVMPFGRTFTGVFESALRRSFSKYSVCFDNACFNRSMTQGGPSKLLQIKISSFYTWEGPTNHLNLYAKGSCKIFNKEGTLLNEYPFEKSVLSHKLGNIFNTHSNFIDAMNTLLNQFCEGLTTELITKSFI